MTYLVPSGEGSWETGYLILHPLLIQERRAGNNAGTFLHDSKTSLDEFSIYSGIYEQVSRNLPVHFNLHIYIVETSLVGQKIAKESVI